MNFKRTFYQAEKRLTISNDIVNCACMYLANLGNAMLLLLSFCLSYTLPKKDFW